MRHHAQETMTLRELEGLPARARSRKEDKAERGKQSFAIKIARLRLRAGELSASRGDNVLPVQRCLAVN